MGQFEPLDSPGLCAVTHISACVAAFLDRIPRSVPGVLMAEPRYRWVIVAAGAVMGCIALGAMFSLPVLLRPITANTGWSTTGVSAAMTIGFLAMAVGS